MSATAGSRGAAPNWYPDPSNPLLLRYWDGTRWTENTAPTTTWVPGAPPAAAAAAPNAGSSNKVLWIVLGVFGGLVAIGVILVLAAVAIPVAITQQAKAEDAQVKADVSTLGREIATWYVDNEDSPPPAVETLGGSFYVDGVKVATARPNVVLGGVTGTGSTDWCVWATNPEGDLKDFQYSAYLGLQQGTC